MTDPNEMTYEEFKKTSTATIKAHIRKELKKQDKFKIQQKKFRSSANVFNHKSFIGCNLEESLKIVEDSFNRVAKYLNSDVKDLKIESEATYAYDSTSYFCSYREETIAENKNRLNKAVDAEYNKIQKKFLAQVKKEKAKKEKERKKERERKRLEAKKKRDQLKMAKQLLDELGSNIYEVFEEINAQQKPLSS